MKLIYLILMLLLVVAACVVGVLLVGEPTASTGMAHLAVEGMRSGGDGLTRFAPVSSIALVMFSAILVLFGVLLYLGVSKHRRMKQCRAWIAAGTIALLLVWWSMFGTYSEYLASGEFRLLLGFPLPTAFMVYGLWLGGFVFVIAYVIGFRSFVISEEDEVAYHKLLEKYKHDRSPN
ncbi:MAG: hypothetical protein ACE5KS_04930 [Woeseiaceae bacterium]